MVVFNGYPQHQNFQLTVDYEDLEHTRIAFFSTYDDPVIPYEFLLIEYCKQKSKNANTYLHISEGGHAFRDYQQAEIDICFNILTAKINNAKTEPIQAYIENDKVLEFYPFRKKIYKKYSYGKEYLEENQAQAKLYGK